MFREWLGTMISQDGSFTVCGETDNVAEALTLVQRTKPDVAIVDLTLRGTSGLELIKNLKAHDLKTPVLVLSMHDEELYAERVLRAGGRGYLSKHAASSTLLQALQCVIGGDVYLDPRITAGLLKRMSGGAAMTGDAIDGLADRELEVYQLVGRGFNARKIAEQLNLGETTVETYRQRIKEKLNLKNAAELYAHAARWVQQHGG